MINEAVFEKWMTQPIDHVHVSNSHGDVIEIYFRDGNKMYIWAFKHPTDLQAVLIDEQHRIIEDFRNQACKDHSDEWIRRFPGEGRTFVCTHG